MEMFPQTVKTTEENISQFHKSRELLDYIESKLIFINISLL